MGRAPEFVHRLPGIEFAIHEWREYHLTIPEATGLRLGNEWISPIGGTHIFILQINNKLGTVALTPYFAGVAGSTIHAEVLAGKFRSVGESLRFMQALVDQLSARIRTIPFVVKAETARQIVREHGTPNLFFTFHYLRHHGEQLARALSVIALDPHRKLSDIAEDLRIHQARRIDAEALHSLLTGPRAGAPNRDPDATPLEKLQPLRITQRRPEETYDTPENRFVVAACRRLRTLIELIRKQWWFRSVTLQDIAMLKALDRATKVLRQNGRFRGLGASLRMPAYSRVLQMKPGYMELT